MEGLQLTIFDKYVDKKATQENVKHFLQDEYPRMQRMAGRDNTGISSPSMDGMPKGSNYGNSVERRLVQSIYAKQVVREVRSAINDCDAFSSKVLTMLYLEGRSDTQTYLEIGYQERNYYKRIKPRALLEFAEAYMLDDLKIYKVQ
ncbi:ArpU family phage packaging/lysis transcriptional regulator [Limosilactobacillus caecicola]|uniref:ArpU family phage packaging/lysis transcriptional regulator n=1 Tax=Limosilactobacillus caecicola TaxID=2941332 RepID=UPI00203B0067|nr:ArpU family phage packaging/lysis transcriptional regulator [Limosilactobacillus caecicola]